MLIRDLERTRIVLTCLFARKRLSWYLQAHFFNALIAFMAADRYNVAGVLSPEEFGKRALEDMIEINGSGQ